MVAPTHGLIGEHWRGSGGEEAGLRKPVVGLASPQLWHRRSSAEHPCHLYPPQTPIRIGTPMASRGVHYASEQTGISLVRLSSRIPGGLFLNWEFPWDSRCKFKRKGNGTRGWQNRGAPGHKHSSHGVSKRQHL